MTAGSAASRRVLARTPVAPLPASSSKRPTGITGRMSAPPEMSSPEVCGFRLPQMCGFRLPWTAGIDTALIDPGKPWQNATDESFNGRFRDECLNEHWFTTLAHAQALIEAWRCEYNEERPKKGGSPDIKVGLSPGRSDQELCDLGRKRLIHGFFWDLPEQCFLASVDGRLRRPRSGWGACSAVAKSRRKVLNLWLLLDDRWAGDTAQVVPVR